MAKNSEKEVKDYRHDTSKRKNNPPAGIAGQGRTPDTPKQEYAYNPHLPPILRSDPHGDADKLPELLQKAQQEPLTPEEAKIIADALKHHEPWLEWAGKQEAKSFTVDPVALHVHERVSTKAILKVAERENVQRQLFADPQQTYNKAVEFYKHDVDWANRLILGDSLMVMSSLAHTRRPLSWRVFAHRASHRFWAWTVPSHLKNLTFLRIPCIFSASLVDNELLGSLTPYLTYANNKKG